MSEPENVIRLYYMPLSFPCGPQSSCCGPVGQSPEELREWTGRVTGGIPGARVEAVDVSKKLNLGRDGPALKLLKTFGAAACPIFTVAGEVVSMGPPAVDELVELVRTRLAHV